MADDYPIIMTSYDILLSLTVTHPYFLSKEGDADSNYTYSKAFEDFELLPDKKTVALMSSLKLIAKKINNSWMLLFQKDGPFATTVALLENKEFFFEMTITNDTFYKVTHRNYLQTSDEMLWFNSPINSVMVPEKRKVQQLQFEYVIHNALRPVNIKVLTAKGEEILDDTIGDVLIKKQQVDVTGSGENMYNITEDTVPPGSLVSEKIFAKETEGAGAFYGVVYFKVLPVDINAAANNFKIDVEMNY